MFSQPGGLWANSLVAHERTWRAFLAWAAASSLDPRGLPFPQALEIYRLLGKENGPASLKQIRAALSFAYKHWDLKNPFARSREDGRLATIAIRAGSGPRRLNRKGTTGFLARSLPQSTCNKRYFCKNRANHSAGARS